jgi:hypothetical protein
LATLVAFIHCLECFGGLAQSQHSNYQPQSNRDISHQSEDIDTPFPG